MEKKICYSFKSLGTQIEIQLVVENERQTLQSEKLLAAIEGKYAQAMQIFSRFEQDSELSLLNNRLGSKSACSDWMCVVATKCLEYYKTSEGLFDPRIIDALETAGYDRDFAKINQGKQLEISRENEQRILAIQKPLAKDLLIDKGNIQFNCRMDFSGIVKGFVTDQICKFLKGEGLANFLLSSGGDIYAAGHDANEQFWYISIEGVAEEKILLKLSDEAVATSGINRRKWERAGKRMHHLINPAKPGDFSFELKTVTVLAPTTQMADAWAKVLFLADKEKVAQFANQFGLKYILRNYRDQTIVSDSFQENLY